MKEEWGKISEIDHFEIVRYNPGLSMLGVEPTAGEVVAIIQPDGSAELLEDESILNAPHELEFLVTDEPQDFRTELGRSRNIYDPDEKKKYEERHHDRWSRRTDEAGRRMMEQRYAPDLYDGDPDSPEIPYGQEIEDLEDNELNNLYSSLYHLGNRLDKLGYTSIADQVDSLMEQAITNNFRQN